MDIRTLFEETTVERYVEQERIVRVEREVSVAQVCRLIGSQHLVPFLTVVVVEEDKPVACLSLEALCRAAASKGCDGPGGTIGELIDTCQGMREKLLTIGLGASLAQAWSLFEEHTDIETLLVVDGEGRLVGQISLYELLTVAARHHYLSLDEACANIGCVD